HDSIEILSCQARQRGVADVATNERGLDTGVFRPLPAATDRVGGIVDAGDAETMPRQEQRIATDPTSEIEYVPGPDLLQEALARQHALRRRRLAPGVGHALEQCIPDGKVAIGHDRARERNPWVQSAKYPTSPLRIS